MIGRAGLIVIGLGNPGLRYRDTRHNVGFWFVDYLAHQWDFPIFQHEEDLLLSDRKFRGREVLLAKPVTYMNRSGAALASLACHLEFERGDLLVCHDDIDIPVGRFKLKASGGAGGHKGVISILEYLGGEDVMRLRFGILPEIKPADLEAFVLSPFEEGEEKAVLDLFPRARDAVACLLDEGIEKAMSLYNRNHSDPDGGAAGDAELD